jgi:outer membrane protein OmpA-like peptidoglycan-associated protein
MRSLSLLGLSAGLWLASYGAGMAQGVSTGLEVRVNPGAGRSSGILLYPGGEYSRVVPQLLYAGQRGGPVNLYPPGTRRVVRSGPVRMASAAPPPPRVQAAPPPPRVQPAPPPPRPQAAPPPAASGSNPFLGSPNLSNVFGGTPSAPKPAPPPRTPPASDTAGLTKRSVILFARDASEPADGALGAIKFLAVDLNSAMTRASSRVELQAFGGGKGDKGSDARRLSLKRALAIRQVLINDGVSPDRIDVRAMGGADDSGPADRVDVYVRA